MAKAYNIEEYDFLYIIPHGIFKNSYKVKHKQTDVDYVWKSIDYKHMTEDCKEMLLENIETASKINHPNVVQSYNYIHHEDITTFYIIFEACVETNLTTFVKKIVKNNEYITESFVWRTIYQICCVNKTYPTTTNVTLDNIFISSTNDVKVNLLDCSYNDTLPENDNNFNHKKENTFLKNLVQLIYELCALKKLNDTFDEIPSYYSDDLRRFLTFLYELNPDTSPDVILCHPTILIKHSKYKDGSGKLSEVKESESDRQIEPLSEDNDYRQRLENVRNREAAVKIREANVKEQERNLNKREKKIALHERMAKEKIARANVYLNRCKESKSSIRANKENGQSKSRLYRDVDSSYSADPGDTTITLTSTRLKLEDIVRPNLLSKNVDFRKVRFKGHSPLKEKCFNKEYKIPYSDRSTVTSETQSDRSSAVETKKKCGLFRMLSTKSKKSAKSVDDVDGASQTIQGVRPVSWTEENKRQAFDLLRMMNTDVDKDYSFKQTQL